MTAPMAPGLGSRSQWLVVGALGINQILAWGSSYYLPAVLAKPVAEDTGWPLTWVVGGFTAGLLVAGAISPRVGREIERFGGRPVLAVGAMMLALGHVGLALAQHYPLHVLAWLVMGVGIGAGLYDPAFATLGRLYGTEARRAITTLTLYGGFASTVCWPLSAFLAANLGWRGACLVYAAIDLLVLLPICWFALPREERRDLPAPSARKAGPAAGEAEAAAAPSASLFWLVALCLTLSSVITAVFSVHLLTVLQARDIPLAAAVGLGALVGPSQVGARVVEMAVGRHFHPVWTMVVSTLLVSTGIAMLLLGFPILALALVLYGAGVGIRSIARGTLPLALFGATGYAILMGKLGRPSMLASALAPGAAAFLLDLSGANVLLAALLAFALIDVALALAVVPHSRRRPAG